MRVLLKTAVLALASLLFCLPVAASGPPLYDIAIIGGRVLDPETGLDEEGLNVGVNGGVIAAVTSEPISGRAEIDARGLVVAPGFIDLMSYDPNGYGVWHKIADGVTTNLAMHGGAVSPEKWHAAYGKKALPLNYGAGFFYKRARMGLGIGPYRAAAPQELERLESMAEKALGEGALGIGISLEYDPGISAGEVERMMRVAQRAGVPVFFHVRHSDMTPPGTNIDALEEVLGLARKTGAAVHIDHINSTGGTFSMAESLAMMEEARAEGVDATACAYPYDYWGTYLNSARFDKGWQERFRISYGDLQIGGSPERLTEESFRKYRRLGKLAVAYAIPAADVEASLKAPFVMIGSDGIIEPGNNNHPRGAGAFSRTIALYAREKGALTLLEAIGKMTLLPARRLEGAAPGFRKKGRLQPGADADIVVFDYAAVADRATVERPNRFSEGFRHVIVNGKVVLDETGFRKGSRAGRGIRRGE